MRHAYTFIASHGLGFGLGEDEDDDRPPGHCEGDRVAAQTATSPASQHRTTIAPFTSIIMGGMWRLRLCFAAAALVLALWGSGAHAVQFEVSSRTTKCIAEEIQSHVVVVGDYKIVHSDEAHKVTVKV